VKPWFDPIAQWDEELARQFWWDNQDLSTTADGFVIRFEAKTGAINMLLEISTTTRKEDLRQGWSLIAQWQGRLRRWRAEHAGDEISRGRMVDLKSARAEGRRRMLNQMHEMNEAGKSPRQIAKHLNGYIEQELLGYLEAVKEHGAQAADFKNILDGLRWHRLTGDYWTGLHYVRWLLADLGMPAEEVETWCTDGLQNLRDGRPAFLPGLPITTDRVREQLRYYF
jgi:hypothetical protein